MDFGSFLVADSVPKQAAKALGSLLVFRREAFGAMLGHGRCGTVESQAGQLNGLVQGLWNVIC
jgi:hypothetical protein